MRYISSKIGYSFIALAAFLYKADLPIFAQTSVQKLYPVPQPTMNLPETNIGDDCSFILKGQREPVFFCLTANDIASANLPSPQYQFKTYLYSQAPMNFNVAWRAKPQEASWMQQDRLDKSIHQIMADGKILIWQGIQGSDRPVLLNQQGQRITVPGIFRLEQDKVYQQVDLTKIQDPKFLSTEAGEYILTFSEIQNGQKYWKVWGLGIVSEKLGGGQLTILWEKTIPLKPNIDRVTFFQTSDGQTIVFYLEIEKDKAKIQVINFGRLTQAEAKKPIPVWQQTLEIPEVGTEKFLAEQSLIHLQEYKTGQFLLWLAFVDSTQSKTYDQQCFWVFREGIGSNSGFSAPLCKNYYSTVKIDQQGNLWLAHLEKANSQKNPDLVVEILNPFASPFWGNPSLNKNLNIQLPAGLSLREASLASYSIQWMDTILTKPNPMPKLLLVVGGVYEEKIVDVFLRIDAHGKVEKLFILPEPMIKGEGHSGSTQETHIFLPISFEGKISEDQKYAWISGIYWWPFSTILPGGNSRSQLFYVPLEP